MDKTLLVIDVWVAKRMDKSTGRQKECHILR